MLFFYRLFISLYTLAVRIMAQFQPKAKLFVEGRKDLLFKIKAQLGNEQRPRIWMHCASLGEFEQGRPVIESLKQQYPQHAIVITFFSPSGYQVIRKYSGADYVFYLPLDRASNAKQFILNINPALAIFVKYDLWYFYLATLYKKQIPVLLIDAIFRPQQGYFKWYGTIQRQMLRFITHIFVQNQSSVDLLSSIGINQVSLAGDTRFDRVLSVAQSATPIDKVAALAQQYKLFIAGSTWLEDEQLLLSLMPHLPADWKLIIVPHEVDEKHIVQIEKMFCGRMLRWSQWHEAQSLDKQVLVVDTIGLLLKLYRYGQMAWIGGGLGKGGVHNVLEAAVYGLPCAFGPVYQKYQEAIALIEKDAAVVCTDAASLHAFFQEMAQDKTAFEQRSNAARNYVAAQGGATPLIIRYLVAKNWLSTL
jgi:3-deoxy-D-manno-octulosonic-acid transferase